MHDELTQPIANIELRIPQEVFDIMCSRIGGYFKTSNRPPVEGCRHPLKRCGNPAECTAISCARTGHTAP